jgi:hypothetical protein
MARMVTRSSYHIPLNLFTDCPLVILAFGAVQDLVVMQRSHHRRGWQSRGTILWSGGWLAKTSAEETNVPQSGRRIDRVTCPPTGASKKARLRASRGRKTQAMTVLSAKQTMKQRREGGRKPLATRTIPINLSE